VAGLSGIALIVAGYILIDQMGATGAASAAAAPARRRFPSTVTTAENKDVPIIVRVIGTCRAISRGDHQGRVDGRDRQGRLRGGHWFRG